MSRLANCPDCGEDLDPRGRCAKCRTVPQDLAGVVQEREGRRRCTRVSAGVRCPQPATMDDYCRACWQLVRDRGETPVPPPMGFDALRAKIGS